MLFIFFGCVYPTLEGSNILHSLSSITTLPSPFRMTVPSPVSCPLRCIFRGNRSMEVFDYG